MRKPGLVFGLALACAAPLWPGGKEFQWPPLPGREELAEMAATSLASGLVMAQREVKITIRSLGYEPYGVIREEFIRLVVVSEAGVTNANLEVVGESEGRLSLVEGRTVLKDGHLVPLRDQDVETLEVYSGRKKELLRRFAKVHFPNPAVGAILDLHFTVETNDLVWVYVLPMAMPGIPLINGHFKVSVKTAPSPLGWSLLAIGPGKATVQPTNEPDTMEATLLHYTPSLAEPVSVPSHHEVMTLVAFVNFDALRGTRARPGQRFTHSSAVDLWGRVIPDAATDPGLMDYFHRYLRDQEKDSEGFLKKGFPLTRQELEAIAPSQASLEERTAALYRYLQRNLRWNPEFKAPKDLRQLLQKGMSDSREGTLALVALLRSAGIPARLGSVANRYFFRFSPVIHNEYLFGFEPVVVVERPKAPALTLMVGELPLPFGALPLPYQHGLVLLPEEDGKVQAWFTEPNKPGVDAALFSYRLELNESGAASGQLQIEKRGAMAWPLATWELVKEAWFAGKATKKHEKETNQRQWEEEERLWLARETTIPGSLFSISQPRLTHIPRTGEEALTLTARLDTIELLVGVGNQVFLPAYPLLAGFRSPLVEKERFTPIWNEQAGRYVLEGTVVLPLGAKVLAKPTGWELSGPLDTTAVAEVRTFEEDGRTVIWSRLSYDLPSIIPVNEYPSWQAFLTLLEKAGQERLLLSWPGEKPQ